MGRFGGGLKGQGWIYMIGQITGFHNEKRTPFQLRLTHFKPPIEPQLSSKNGDN
jgi:hypothetical protein